MSFFDFEKAKKEKQIVTSFLDAHQDKEKLKEWKKQNRDRKKEDEKKDTFWF